MKKKMVGIFVCALLIAATVIPVAGTLISIRNIEIDTSELEEGVTSIGQWYNPAGAWKRSDNELFSTCSPAGPTGLGRYSFMCEGKSIDPTWYGMFPNATDLSLMCGEMIKTGMNTYELTLLDYAINPIYGVEYFRLWNGVVVMTSKDTMYANFTASIYGPDQDPFGEEEPLYYCWGPWEFTYERIPVVPPC